MKRSPLVLVLTLALSVPLHAAGGKLDDCCAIKELTWKDLTGVERTMQDYAGRVVVLNFWATWCAPCREEFPELVRIQNRYGMYGVQVLGASADAPGERETVIEVARESELNFPVLLGADTHQLEVFGLGDAIPATLVFDRDGNVVERVSGIFDPDDLKKVLDGLVIDTTAAEAESRADGSAHAHAEDDGHDQGHDHGAARTGEASLVPS